MEIGPLGVEFFQADRQKELQRDMMKLILAFRSFYDRS